MTGVDRESKQVKYQPLTPRSNPIERPSHARSSMSASMISPVLATYDVQVSAIVRWSPSSQQLYFVAQLVLASGAQHGSLKGAILATPVDEIQSPSPDVPTSPLRGGEPDGAHRGDARAHAAADEG